MRKFPIGPCLRGVLGVVCLWTGARAETSTPLTLVEAGSPRATIVLAARPTKSAQLAAFELREHVKLITGVELPIQREAPGEVADGVRLCIGETGLALKRGLTRDQFDVQEYAVTFEPNAIVFAGRDSREFGEVSYKYVPSGAPDPTLRAYDVQTWPSFWSERGSLNAVYDFLERFCGVRWFTPTEFGTVADPRETLTVRGENLRRHRSFRFSRGPHHFIGTITPWDSQEEGYARYMEAAFPTFYRTIDRARVRRAYIVRAGRAFLYRKRYGGEWFCANHSFASFFPRFWAPHPGLEELFEKKRPELFAKGYKGKPPQLCLIEPKTLAQFIEDARDYFDGADTPLLRWHRTRYPDTSNYFAVVPNDNVNWCTCNACQRQLVQQQAYKRVTGWASEYVWGFVNKVAEEVGKTHPDKWVAGLAYWHYSYPPKTVRLRDNIAVQICMQIRMPYWLERQRVDWDMANAWGREYPEMPKYVWVYYGFPEERCNRSPGVPDWHCFPGFFAHTIGTEFRKYRDIGVRGMYFNGFGYNVENYVTFGLLDDVERDVDYLLGEYFTKMFGPAGEALRTFYNLAEEIYVDPRNYPIPDPGHQVEYYAWGFLGTPARMKRLGDLMSEAEALVGKEGTAEEKRRVDLFKMNLWDYMLKGREMYEKKSLASKGPRRRVVCPHRLNPASPGERGQINWEDAQALDQWQPVPGEGTHRHVIGDILYDADYLHVRLRDLALLERPVSRDDPAAGDYWKILWGDQDEQSVWQITVNPEGKTSVKRRTRNTETSIDELTMDVASNVGEDDWTVLVAIPLTVLPVQQNTILMNFARGSGASNDLALYAPTNRKLKDLDSFARVILGNPDVADVAPVAVSEEGLILSWDFENDDDIVRDGSSMGNTGELKGPVLREDGPFGRCIRIRGLKSIQNHVELNNLKGLKRDSPFTFSMWVNLEMSRWHLVNHTVKHTILEIPSGILIRASNPGRPSSGRPSVICPPMDDTSAARLESNIQTLTPLAWEHLAVTYDGRRVVLYVNGRLAAQADSVKLSALGDGTGTLRLGTHSSGKHHRHFRGLMDGVKIYRRAWSHDEVLAHYRQGLKHIKHWVSEHVGEE